MKDKQIRKNNISISYGTEAPPPTAFDIVCTNQRGKFFAKLSAKESGGSKPPPYDVEILFAQILDSRTNRDSRFFAYFLSRK